MTCSADAPTKTNLNGKVLARLRSTAGTNLLPQSGLARSSSSLSGELQLSGTISPVPSIGRLGSLAAGPPTLNKLAGAVGLGAARRSADLPLQQLMGMQTPGKSASQQVIMVAAINACSSKPMHLFILSILFETSSIHPKNVLGILLVQTSRNVSCASACNGAVRIYMPHTI